MVLSVKKWCIIQEFVKKNTSFRVSTLWNIRMKAKSLPQQQSVDREILVELGLSSCPAYGFSSNIIHCPDHYEEVGSILN
jgi:hypothetical protein